MESEKKKKKSQTHENFPIILTGPQYAPDV